MPLKNVKRVTFSLPKTTLKKLEMNIPKSRRSKFIAEAIEKNLKAETEVAFEEVKAYWLNLAQKTPRKSHKTATQLSREEHNNR